MNHFLLGAAIPFFIAFVIYAARGFRATFRMLVSLPIFMVLFIIWGIIPDLPRLWGGTRLYYKMKYDPRTEIFLWHYTLDQMEDQWHWFQDFAWVYIAFALLWMALLFAAWRELRIAEGEDTWRT